MAELKCVIMEPRARNEQNGYPMNGFASPSSFTALPKPQFARRWPTLNATPRSFGPQEQNGIKPEASSDHRPFVQQLPDRPADAFNRTRPVDRLPSVQTLLNDTPPGSEVNGVPPSRLPHSSPIQPPSYYTPPPSIHSQSDTKSHKSSLDGTTNLVDRSGRSSSLLPPLSSSHSAPAIPESTDNGSEISHERDSYASNATAPPILAHHSAQFSQSRLGTTKRRKSDFDGERSFHSNESSISERPRSSASTGSYRRCLGQREVPGKGLCFIYEDGSEIPATIDGEEVNPDWGITKAGKPRKRLAHACTNCREKKIKCEPGVPSCSQCLKLGRECSRSQDVPESPDSPASSRISPTTRRPAYLSGDGLDGRYNSSREPNTPNSARLHHHSLPSTTRASIGDEPAGRRNKRQRSQSSEPERPQSSTDRSSIGSHNMNNAGANDQGPVGTLEVGESRDPFEVNPNVTRSLLDLYFRYRDTQTSKLLPKLTFMRWVEQCKTKTVEDIMVIYSLLGLGSVFTDSPELKDMGKTCANQALKMERDRRGSMTLQMAHTRLHLSIYHQSKENRNTKHLALDYRGGAWRIISVLGLNTEAGCKALAAKQDNEYGLSRDELTECCRRTFWLTYMIDGTGGYCAGQAGLINNDDILLHLPNNEDDYEAGRSTPGPIYDRDAGLSSSPELPGATAMLAGIISIWKEVCAFNYRSIHSLNAVGYREKYLRHHNAITSRLQHFESNLPTPFMRGVDNTRAAIADNYFMTYYSVHSLICSAMMKLNRFGRVDSLDHNTIRSQIGNAHKSARNFLTIIKTLSPHLSPPLRTSDIESALSAPFTSCAVLTACDIISSGGTSDTLDATQSYVSQSKAAIEQTARFFGGARKQYRMLEEREVDFNSMRHQGVDMSFWRMVTRIESVFMPEEFDLIYGSSKELYREAILELNADSSDERTPRQ